MRKETRHSLLILAAFLLMGVLAVWGQYRWDNKYTAALSGDWGVSVLQTDPEKPAWLVDGWEFYPGELLSPEDFRAGRSAEQYTYAGQYPNFSAQLGSPYGEATYRIVLENPGEPLELSLYLPELLATLVHDLKNPLAAVRSYADLVRGSSIELDEETAACLDALSERVGAVEDRFGLLQGFSRAERAAAGAERLELSAFLRGFYESNRPDMELSGQRFCLELSRGELYVAAEEQGLRAALENLCYNALSFTPPGGRITLSLRCEDGYAVIAVSDTGSGIAPEDMPHIFERGFTRRADNSGEGLGLYIVRTFALEQGGSVDAESEQGRGSVFTLRLPRA